MKDEFKIDRIIQVKGLVGYGNGMGINMETQHVNILEEILCIIM